MKRSYLQSILLVFAMVMGMLPIQTYAAGSDPVLYNREIRADEEQEITSWTDLQSLISKDGEITLTENLTAPADAEALTVPKGVTVTLNLAGNTLNRGLTAAAKNGSVIIVNGTLTLIDSEGNGKITGGYTSGTGGGVWVRSGGSFTLKSGAIQYNRSKYVGGGVYISGTNASFVMNGGVITDNEARNGGGVGMDGKGSFTMNDGYIQDNIAASNGAGVWVGKGTVFTMNGGEIVDGIYNNGGIIYNNTGGDVNEDNDAYDIRKNVIGEGGSVTVKVDGDEVTEAYTGDVVTVEVQAQEDDYYVLKSLRVTTGEGDEETEIAAAPGENGIYTFVMPAENVKVSAEFGQQHEISTRVALRGDDNNYVNHGCTLTADKNRAVAGETVTLTLQMQSGYIYQYSDVLYDGDYHSTSRVNDTTFTFIMPDSDVEAVAYIQKGEYKVSLAGSASRNVEFLKNNEPKDDISFYADYDDDITILFYPEFQMIKAMTYSFTIDDVTITNSLDYDENEYPVRSYFRMPASDVTVHVEYNEIHNVIENQTPGGIILADVTKAAEESTVTVYASPDERYKFSAWNFTPAVALLSDETDSDGTRIAKFTMPNADVTFSAAFVQDKYDIVSSAEHGTVNVESWAEAGSKVSFTLTPDQYYALESVTVTGSGEIVEVTEDNGTYTFVMPSENVAIHAVFDIGPSWSDLRGVLKTVQGGTVTLNHDYTAEEDSLFLYLVNASEVTIDLNGHVIDSTAFASAEDAPEDALLLAGEDVILKDSAGKGEIKGAGTSGIVNVSTCTFTMESGTISGSGSSIWSTVYVEHKGEFIMEGGKVTGDSCANVVSSSGRFTMSGGEISGTVEENVVFFHSQNEDFYLSGGKISGTGVNGAEPYAICLAFTNLYLSGSPVVSAGENGKNGVYVMNFLDFDELEYMIYVDGPLEENLSIGVAMSEPGEFVKGNDEYELAENDTSHFVSADPKYRVILNDNKYGELVEPPYEIAIPETENGTVTASVNGQEAVNAFGNETIDLIVSPAPGYRLKSLTVSSGGSFITCSDADEHRSFTMPEGDVTVNAVFEKQTPSFANMSLVLAGEIVMRFYMDLPVLDGVDYSSSYMTFAIPHGTCTPEARYKADVNITAGSHTYYGFDCCINAIQMAEPVTATFHYQQGEEEKTMTITCSAKDYFTGFDDLVQQNQITDPRIIDLVHALADYGHYVQPFLAEQRQWILGADYETMDKFYAQGYDISAIQNAVSDQTVSFINNTDGDINLVYFSLTLDSNTVINLYIETKDTWQGTLKAKVDDGQETVLTEGSDGYYRVRIEGIAAHELSQRHTIILTTGEGHTATVQVSALSYVNQALNYYTDTDTNARNAVASLYRYSKAADDYLKRPD